MALAYYSCLALMHPNLSQLEVPPFWLHGETCASRGPSHSLWLCGISSSLWCTTLEAILLQKDTVVPNPTLGCPQNPVATR